MLFERTFDELIGESLAELVSDTRITRISPGSKARTILEIINRNINQAYQIFDLNFARVFLSGASGKYLDLIGEILGMSRLGIETAKASSTSQVLKFYVQSGSFGDINNNSSITIPAGTIISTATDSLGIQFRSVVGTVLSSSGSAQFVSVEAVSPGEASNIGAETLKFHNFTDYEDIDNDSLKVINVSGIFNGANLEIDTNYKYRLSKSVLSAEAANETSCMLAALSVPGVANVVMQNRAKGIGTYRILIKSITPSVSEALLDNVQASLTRVSAQGVLPFVDRPLETGMEFVVTVTYKNGIADEEKDLIEQQIELSIINYVNNLDIGEEFILNEVTERILSVSESIKDIGQPNKPLDTVYIYKETRLQDNKIREELLVNYDPVEEERIIIEPSLTTPITIIRAN